VLLIKHGKLRYAWVTAVPLVWDLVVTMTASWQKVFSGDPRVGYFTQAGVYRDARDAGEVLAPAQDVGQMDQIIFNSTLNGILQSVFALLVVVVVVNAVVVIARAIRSNGLPTTEEPAVPSRLVEPAGLFATAEEKQAIAEHERLVGAGGRP
jgi:carbon starvation protein